MAKLKGGVDKTKVRAKNNKRDKSFFLLGGGGSVCELWNVDRITRIRPRIVYLTVVEAFHTSDDKKKNNLSVFFF